MMNSFGDGPSKGTNCTAGILELSTGTKFVFVPRELADEARKCLPHITDPSVRMILEKVANCYPEDECK